MITLILLLAFLTLVGGGFLYLFTRLRRWIVSDVAARLMHRHTPGHL